MHHVVAHLRLEDQMRAFMPDLDFKWAGASVSGQLGEWLAMTIAGDAKISSEYRSAITKSNGPLATPAGKLTRSIAMTAVGAAIGAAVVQSPLGATFGGAVGAVAEPAVHLELDLVDELLLDGPRRGWTPRMFFDDLRMLKYPDLRGTNNQT